MIHCILQLPQPHRQVSHNHKEPTSDVIPPSGKLKNEIAYNPERESVLMAVYARNKQQKELTEQRRCMQDAGLLNIPA